MFGPIITLRKKFTIKEGKGEKMNNFIECENCPNKFDVSLFTGTKHVAVRVKIVLLFFKLSYN